MPEHAVQHTRVRRFARMGPWGRRVHGRIRDLAFDQLADALEATHRRGILHRDLKPPNILVTPGGQAKLLDFGVAQLLDRDTDVTKTSDRAVAGTVAYMSPEQAKGKALDARSDIFSLGLVLYELLAGRRAFEGDTSVQVLAAVLADTPAPLELSPTLDAVVMRCLEKDPSLRFQSMAELKEALERGVQRPAPGAQPSVAVLPFANLSADQENEYFADGLAEEIINALSQVPGLKVIARTWRSRSRDGLRTYGRSRGSSA